MWRGQENSSWQLHSTAYRRLLLSDKPVTEAEIQRYEVKLLARATHRGFRSSDTGQLSDLELLARLQHHGAATRLMDFTRSAMVALWFATRAAFDVDGMLIGVHTDHLGGYEGEPNAKSYEEIFSSLVKYDLKHSQTWEPSAVSARVAAQQSQFLYSPIVSLPSGSLAIEKPEHLLCFEISGEMKGEVQKVLTSLFGIHHTSLFPDLDGFGYANSFRFEQYANSRW